MRIRKWAERILWPEKAGKGKSVLLQVAVLIRCCLVFLHLIHRGCFISCQLSSPFLFQAFFKLWVRFHRDRSPTLRSLLDKGQTQPLCFLFMARVHLISVSHQHLAAHGSVFSGHLEDLSLALVLKYFVHGSGYTQNWLQDRSQATSSEDGAADRQEGMSQTRLIQRSSQQSTEAQKKEDSTGAPLAPGQRPHELPGCSSWLSALLLHILTFWNRRILTERRDLDVSERWGK